jgi:hypothetical protein
VYALAPGVPPQTLLTRKTVDIRGVVAQPPDPPLDGTQREAFLKVGALHVFQAPGTNRWVIPQGITTIQAQDRLRDPTMGSSREISLMRIADALPDNIGSLAEQQSLGTTVS